MIQALSELMGRMALASKMGVQYAGDRDIYAALGYAKEVTYRDCKAQFLRNDIAKAVIDRPAKATWQGDLQVSEPSDADETPFELEWRRMVKEHRLKYKFSRADVMTCIGRYGVLMLGLDDVYKKEDHLLPAEGKRKLMYVRPLGEESARVSVTNTDTTDERYGLPEVYEVTIGKDTLKVHHTRIVHIVHDKLESDVYGTPVLECVFNRLQDLEKLVGASAEMFWRGARPGYQGKVDEGFSLDEQTRKALGDQVEEFEHNLRRIFVNEGIKLEALASQVADPSHHVDVQIQMISAATGIPKRILTGSERGELASSQDVGEWNKLIQSRRQEYAETQIVRPFIDRCQELGILPETDEYAVVWSDLHTVSDKDRAEVGRIRAAALKEYSAEPLAADIIPPAAFMEFMLGLDQEQIELIGEMREQALQEEEKDFDQEGI